MVRLEVGVNRGSKAGTAAGPVVRDILAAGK